jgi:hypothetical protein
VYSNGQLRDVRVRVARAGDLPRLGGMMIYGGMGMGPPPMPPVPRGWPMSSVHWELGPQIEAGLREAAMQLDRVRPEVDRVLRDLPRMLEQVRVPDLQLDVNVDGAARVRTVAM